MMIKDDAQALEVGQRVRVLVPGCGDVDDVLTHFEADAIVTVEAVETFPGSQGLSITVSAENGVVNVFDEGDYGGQYPFEVLPCDNFQTDGRGCCRHCSHFHGPDALTA